MRDENRPVWCRHHRKPKPMVDACELGVDINAMAPRGMFGQFYALPCHDQTSNGIAKAKCDKCSLFTPEEVAQQDAERAEWMEKAKRRLMLTFPLVDSLRARTKKLGVAISEVVDCPVCSGKLSMACSIYNLHVRARCETTNCINFVE